MLSIRNSIIRSDAIVFDYDLPIESRDNRFIRHFHTLGDVILWGVRPLRRIE
jgi:hypothetical protein